MRTGTFAGVVEPTYAGASRTKSGWAIQAFTLPVPQVAKVTNAPPVRTGQAARTSGLQVALPQNLPGAAGEGAAAAVAPVGLHVDALAPALLERLGAGLRVLARREGGEGEEGGGADHRSGPYRKRSLPRGPGSVTRVGVDLPAEAKALLALPPSRFKGARDALAATLAERRDPAAARVRKLGRPVGLAWVLNRLARESPRDVAALLGAGDRVRAGQRRAVSGAGGGALREAEEVLRDRARALRLRAEELLREEGRPASAATLARVELLLRVAATGEDREPLRDGALLREPALGAGELSGFTLVPGGRGALPPPAPRRGARAAPAPRAPREVRDRAERAREREARQQEERDLRERRRALARARASAAAADRRAAAEARRADDAERAAREARERAAAARAEADRLHARALELERSG